MTIRAILDAVHVLDLEIKEYEDAILKLRKDETGIERDKRAPVQQLYSRLQELRRKREATLDCQVVSAGSDGKLGHLLGFLS